MTTSRDDRIHDDQPAPTWHPEINPMAIQKNGKRDYKHAYELQKKDGETKDQLLRQKARRMYDKMGINRKGKDIDHKTPIRTGGKSVRGNLRLRSKHANESDNGH